MDSKRPARNKFIGIDEVAIQLDLANTMLRARLGDDLWNQLHKWTRSCLVTSQHFYETLDKVDAAREVERELKGTAGDAPEIDFSPLVLCLFKAIEIEFERKVLRPFRDTMVSVDTKALSTNDVTYTTAAESLVRFLKDESPPPSLWVVGMLLSEMSKVRADNSGVLPALKLWMRKNLANSNGWWSRQQLSKRLMTAVTQNRNDAAHTKRFSPKDAKDVADSLWGRRGCEGLLPSVLRSIQPIPTVENRLGEFTVQYVALLKNRHWILRATDHMGDRHWLSVVPGSLEKVKVLSDAFRLRRSLKHTNLMTLAKWFPLDSIWGQRVGIVSTDNDQAELARGGNLSEAQSQDLLLALTSAVATFHEADLSHGFISPHVVFRSLDNRWFLGGQALLLLAEEGHRAYLYPRVIAPEVRLDHPKGVTPAADVYSIAATVCCFRKRQPERNQESIKPEIVASLFSDVHLVDVLRRALTENPHERFKSASELLAELTRHHLRQESSSAYPVVLSYSRKDESQAERLMSGLSSKGIRAWRDKEMIPGGTSWRKAIVSAIQNSQCVIFLISRESAKSAQVPRELDIATACGKSILPVYLEDTKLEEELIYLVAGLQSLQFFGRSDEKNLEELVRALKQLGVTPSDIPDR